MKRCHFVITDSGGIQEEAPSLGKPVLLIRDTSERPEAIINGTVRLIGTDEKKLVHEANRLLDDDKHFRKMSKPQNIYGDGTASHQIITQIMKYCNVKKGI